MYNPQKIEKKWQEKWRKAKIFEANPLKNARKKFITIPYPYASGTLHIGHGRSYTNGDIFARYYRSQGYNVLFPMAFHITGTPVLAISSAIQRDDSETINRMKEYVSIHTENPTTVKKIVRSFEDPSKIVKYFSEKIKEDFQSLGLSIDWRREFTTGDHIYNKFIEWQFNKLHDIGYIEKGMYPILFCPSCSNAVGEDDIISGDELDLSIKEFSCIKFQFNDGYIVASTLRPETLFGVTNVWVNPEAIYTKCLIDNEIWYVSKDAISILKNQGKRIKLINEISGRNLVGKKVKKIYDPEQIPILPADFVDIKFGTGIVYSVPAHAPYDFIALEDLKKNQNKLKQFRLNFQEINKIKPLKIINLNETVGIPAETMIKKYDIHSQTDTQKLEKATTELYKKEFYEGKLNKNCKDYFGLHVQDAVETIKEDLNEKQLVDVIYYPTSKNLKCRCGAEVIVSILQNQYFLNYNSATWKKDAYNCLSQMKIFPNKYRLNFKRSFDWLDRRPCARRRGLGTKLPFNKNWIIESLSDSTIYMSFYTIAHKIRENNIDSSQLDEKFFDYIFLNKGSITEVSKQSRITSEILKDMQMEFSYWYPVDLRHTAIMHISNHLSFYIFHHVALFLEEMWPKSISLIEPVIREGRKMGKSKGNVIHLAEIKEKYSIDLFRFFISHAGDFGIKIDWTEERINSTKKHISNFFNFVIKRKEIIISNENPINTLSSKYSKVILSKIIRALYECRKAIEEFSLRKYLQIGFYEIFNLFQNLEKSLINTKEYNTLISNMIPLWLERLNPTIPHITEELWQKIDKKEFLSAKLWTDLDLSLVNDNLEKELAYIENLIEDIRKIEKIIKFKRIEKIYIFTSPDWKYEANRLVKKYEGNFKKIKRNINQELKAIEKNKLFTYILTMLKKRRWISEYNPKNEVKIIEDYQDYIEKKIGYQILINPYHGRKNNSGKAIPGKPAIYIKNE